MRPGELKAAVELSEKLEGARAALRGLVDGTPAFIRIEFCHSEEMRTVEAEIEIGATDAGFTDAYTLAQVALRAQILAMIAELRVLGVADA